MNNNKNQNNISNYSNNSNINTNSFYSTTNNYNQSNNNINNSINSKSQSTTIKVSIRLRPLLPHEDFEYWNVNTSENIITSGDNKKACYSFYEKNPQFFDKSNQLLLDNIYNPQSFKFDKIYTKEVTSEQIYIDTCQNIIKNFIEGINGTIFAYGQTTSGKTYTMLGNVNFPGILPCSLKNLFDLLEVKKNEKNNNFNFKIYCTYIEIYNEIIHDLLSDASGLKIIEDINFGLIVNDVQKVEINSFEEGVILKDKGEEKRQYRNTLYNEYSSRSHSIFQIFLETTEKYNENLNKKYSILNLVDLAGSEKINIDDPNSSETGYINKSLFALANVINKLSENKGGGYIPYRDSKLTRLLSVALGGKSLVNIICNISPSASNYFQTISTLRFASRAKCVKLKPAVNEKIFNQNKLYNISNNSINNSKFMVGNYTINYDDDDNDFKKKYFEQLVIINKLQNENENLKKCYNNIINFDEVKNLAVKIENPTLKELINKNINLVENDYLYKLEELNNNYLQKIDDIKNIISSNVKNEEDVELFSEVNLNFDNINNIQSVKLNYEQKEEELEKLMNEYKENTMIYFQNMRQNHQTDNDDININREYEERMKELEILYENKQKELENNFFLRLRQITDFNKNHRNYS